MLPALIHSFGRGGGVIEIRFAFSWMPEQGTGPKSYYNNALMEFLYQGCPKSIHCAHTLGWNQVLLASSV